jgi:hypothetical protein
LFEQVQNYADAGEVNVKFLLQSADDADTAQCLAVIKRFTTLIGVTYDRRHDEFLALSDRQPALADAAQDAQRAAGYESDLAARARTAALSSAPRNDLIPS